MCIILATCRLAGWVVRRFLHQPQLIGAMIAGALFGPSLLGALAPEAQRFLFPPESKPMLHVVAQLGIALYMFLVGLDFRADDFKANVKGAVPVSLSGIIVPFTVAIVATPLLMGVSGLFAPRVARAGVWPRRRARGELRPAPRG